MLAVAERLAVESVADLPDGVRVSTEYPELTRRFFEKHGIDADIRLSYGATEAKVPDIADAVVDITETGRGPAGRRAARSSTRSSSSYTELIANPAAYDDPEKRHAMDQIHTLLQGTLEARGKVLVKLNVGAADLDAVIELLPSMKSPTVSKLFGEDGYAVETVVPKAEINTLIPALKDARRHRHHRAAAVQDRPLNAERASVVDFDEHAGLRHRRAAEDGRELLLPLHPDRRRHRARSPSGAEVSFAVVPGHLGRWEAAGVEKQ